MTTGLSETDTVTAPTAEVPTRWGLFTAFLKIGLLGFGGVAAISRHVIVVERRFMGDGEFAEALGVASTLPGANTVNLATMLGDRYQGAIGSVIAILGLIGVPLGFLIVVATLYARYSYLPDVRAGLMGAATAAAGLALGTAFKLLQGLDPTLVTLATAACVCIASAILQVPMLLILAVAIPTALALAVRRSRAARP